MTLFGTLRMLILVSVGQTRTTLRSAVSREPLGLGLWSRISPLPEES